MSLRALLLSLLLACRFSEEVPRADIELDRTIQENWKKIQENNKEIAELEKTMRFVEERTNAIRKMIDCTNAAIDSNMNDRDQVMTITECFREAGYR